MGRISGGALALAVSGALTASAVIAADPPRTPPAKIVVDERHFDIAADASSVQKTHMELQILDASAVQAFGQQPISFSELRQELQIDEAFTLKKDGTKIPVAPGAIITQQKPGTTNAPTITDQKQTIVIYPNVEVGDTLVSSRTLKTKPIIPQFYSYGAAFPTSVEVGRSDMVFVAPKSLPLYFDVKDVKLTKSTSGDTIVYNVHFENAKPQGGALQYVSMFDRSPYVYVSSFKTYEPFANAYAALALPKIVVTPKIQAKADEITAGVSERREQVKKIAEWVAGRVRYVALEFGQGSIIAHDPEEVLVNAYGDCKDHSVLFAALLKAKGIASELVVVNATDGFSVPSIPVPNAFNHMINWVPEFSSYVDTTQRTFPFGTLPPTEYGKTVVHFGGKGDPLHKIPVISEKDSTFAYSDHLKLDEAGRVNSEGVLTATGLAAGMARRIASTITMTGSEKSAGEVLTKRGMPSATGGFDLPEATQAASDTFTIKTHYQTLKRPQMISGSGFAMPQGLSVEGLGGEHTLGPINSEKYKNTEVVPCYSNRGTEDYTLEFPAGKKVAALPTDTTIKTDNITYKAHWSLGPHSVTVHREFTAHFDDALCRGSQTRDVRAAIKKIHTDMDTTISLVAE